MKICGGRGEGGGVGGVVNCCSFQVGGMGKFWAGAGDSPNAPVGKTLLKQQHFLEFVKFPLFLACLMIV